MPPATSLLIGSRRADREPAATGRPASPGSAATSSPLLPAAGSTVADALAIDRADHHLARAAVPRSTAPRSSSGAAPASARSGRGDRGRRGRCATPTWRCTAPRPTASAAPQVFDPTMHSSIVERHALTSELGRSVSRGDLTVAYQPIVVAHQRPDRGRRGARPLATTRRAGRSTRPSSSASPRRTARSSRLGAGGPPDGGRDRCVEWHRAARPASRFS